jgi:hypothetical protein
MEESADRKRRKMWIRSEWLGFRQYGALLGPQALPLCITNPSTRIEADHFSIVRQVKRTNCQEREYGVPDYRIVTVTFAPYRRQPSPSGDCLAGPQSPIVIHGALRIPLLRQGSSHPLFLAVGTVVAGRKSNHGRVTGYPAKVSAALLIKP